MRKIKTKNNLNIPGWGFIPAGTAFKVQKFNSKFVYIEINSGVILRLARKKDCEIVY